LGGKTDAEVIREVTACIDEAIGKNRRTEYLAIVVLVSLFTVGLGLLIYGAVVQEWKLLAPGGIVQAIIFWPIRWLIKLREDNMRLQILPQLLRLADSKEAKALAARLVKRLIGKV
jgi:hypothetical protein